MFAFLTKLLLVVPSRLKSRARLEAEILVLRQQVSILSRKSGSRAWLRNFDRLIFVWMYQLFPSILDAITVVKPATVIRFCDKEWARDKIRVNRIAHGLVSTEMGSELVEMFEKEGRYPNPMRRAAEPQEIAAIALYLASDAGSYATGPTFVVDGGELVLAPTDRN